MSPLKTSQVYDMFKNVTMKLDRYEKYQFFFVAEKNDHRIEAIFGKPNGNGLYKFVIHPKVKFGAVGDWHKVTVTKPNNPIEDRVLYSYKEKE